jgi:hypothetical protein
MSDTGSLSLVKKVRNNAPEVDAHHWRYEVHSRDFTQSGLKGFWITPIEADIGASTIGPPDGGTLLSELLRDARSRLARGTENKHGAVGFFYHEALLLEFL